MKHLKVCRFLLLHFLEKQPYFKYIFIIIFLFWNLFLNDICLAELKNKNINVDFQHIPVKDVLQILAKMHHTNLVISDAVKGSITLHLENVSWQKALNVILQEQNLGAKNMDNVLIILPMDEMLRREESQENVNDLLPLRSYTITLHYAKAEEAAKAIKLQNTSLLSARGNITADPRTNTLWIEDVPEKLAAVNQFLHHIDIPVRQVLIEARIVTVDEKYEQELGLRFGLTRPGNNISGSLEAANQLAQRVDSQQINPLSRLNMDLPASAPDSARIGIALASLGGGNLLDLELSALETEGAGQIISSPRLMTADQQSATILSGQEIPYQQAGSYGTTSIAFQKAVLSLTVTPQITPDNHLLLTLQVNQDRPGGTRVQGVPEIDTREIKTQVLVKDGQTIVLGGIYENNQHHQIEKIPFLGDLPGIGKLFQHRSIQNSRRELLIFVTPSIIKSSK